MILGFEYLYYEPRRSKEYLALKKQWQNYYQGMAPFKAAQKIDMRMRKGQKPKKAHYLTPTN